jgi:hypothetical protein
MVKFSRDDPTYPLVKTCIIDFMRSHKKTLLTSASANTTETDVLSSTWPSATPGAWGGRNHTSSANRSLERKNNMACMCSFG